MRATLDMKTIQNMNLFEKITGVKPRCCFDYNQTRFFVVPKFLVKKALGENARNLPRLYVISKRVRIIADPEKKNQEEIEKFIKIVIFPHEFKRLDIVMNQNSDPEIQIYSMPKIKAALIGRNKQRLIEMSQAIEQFFNIKRVVIK